MPMETPVNDIELKLRQHAYTDGAPDFDGVWSRYLQRRGQKEAHMPESRGTVKVLAWLAGFLVIVGVGWFGLTKFAAIKKADKIEKGEAIVVTLIVGDAQVKKMGSTQWRALAVEDALQMGDAVKTSRESYCEIQMVKRGIFRVESATEVYLAKLVNEDDKVNSRMKLDQGGLTLKPGKLKTGENFEVETSTAVAAVRGTKFSVNVDEGGNTRVAVDQGKVAVRPNIKSIEKLTEQGVVEKDATAALQDQIVKSIEVTPGQQANLETKKVEALDQAIGKAIEKVAEKEGPITALQMGVKPAEDKPATPDTPAVPVVAPETTAISASIIQEVRRDVTTSTGASKDGLPITASVVQKEKISEEAKNQLDQLSEERLIEKVEDLIKIRFNSRPEGAEVFVNGARAGVTPLEQIVTRGTKLSVKILMLGYTDYEKDLEAIPGAGLNAELAKIEVPVVEKKLPGQLEWEKPVTVRSGSIDHEVLISRGRIYATAGNRFLILSTEGKVIKSVGVVEDGYRLTRPVASDGLIYMGSDNGGIFAYSPSGELAWKADAGSQKYGASPAAGFGIVAVPSIDKGIMVYSKSGELREAIEVSAPIYSTPLILSGGTVLIYATESGDIVAYDLAAKAKKWTKTYNERFLYPLVGEKTVITLVRNSGRVLGINPADGAVLWSAQFPEIVKTKLNPQYSDGRVILANSGEKSTVIVLNAANGSVIAKTQISDSIGIPFVAGDSIVMGSRSGKIYSYNFSLKKNDWTYASSAKAISMVAADRDGIYAVSPTAMYKIAK